MSTSQPLPTPGAAILRSTRLRSVSPPGQEHDPAQLVRRWKELAVHAAERTAHGHVEHDDEHFSLLLQCEAVLREHHPEHAERWDDLIAWESALIHVGDGPASSCVTCWRARRDLRSAEATA